MTSATSDKKSKGTCERLSSGRCGKPAAFYKPRGFPGRSITLGKRLCKDCMRSLRANTKEQQRELAEFMAQLLSCKKL